MKKFNKPYLSRGVCVSFRMRLYMVYVYALNVLEMYPLYGKYICNIYDSGLTLCVQRTNQDKARETNQQRRSPEVLTYCAIREREAVAPSMIRG